MANLNNLNGFSFPTMSHNSMFMFWGGEGGSCPHPSNDMPWNLNCSEICHKISIYIKVLVRTILVEISTLSNYIFAMDIQINQWGSVPKNLCKQRLDTDPPRGYCLVPVMTCVNNH